ncbi:MAG: hypothetical protein DRN95_09000 [Candidatus Hydrothermarchaeota archaeon]|nr:MAG: hypothetical protein DRN95_09000 [Candidatus Hydrothermarchaeota archaeon]
MLYWYSYSGDSNAWKRYKDGIVWNASPNTNGVVVMEVPLSAGDWVFEATVENTTGGAPNFVVFEKLSPDTKIAEVAFTGSASFSISNDGVYCVGFSFYDLTSGSLKIYDISLRRSGQGRVYVSPTRLHLPEMYGGLNGIYDRASSDGTLVKRVERKAIGPDDVLEVINLDTDRHNAKPGYILIRFNNPDDCFKGLVDIWFDGVPKMKDDVPGIEFMMIDADVDVIGGVEPEGE